MRQREALKRFGTTAGGIPASGRRRDRRRLQAVVGSSGVQPSSAGSAECLLAPVGTGRMPTPPRAVHLNPGRGLRDPVQGSLSHTMQEQRLSSGVEEKHHHWSCLLALFAAGLRLCECVQEQPGLEGARSSREVESLKTCPPAGAHRGRTHGTRVGHRATEGLAGSGSQHFRGPGQCS